MSSPLFGKYIEPKLRDLYEVEFFYIKIKYLSACALNLI